MSERYAGAGRKEGGGGGLLGDSGEGGEERDD